MVKQGKLLQILKFQLVLYLKPLVSARVGLGVTLLCPGLG